MAVFELAVVVPVEEVGLILLAAVMKVFLVASQLVVVFLAIVSVVPASLLIFAVPLFSAVAVASLI